MRTLTDVRLEVLIDAVCALAEALPAEAGRAAGSALAQRVAARRLTDENEDAMVSRDIARILKALGCLSHAAINATHPDVP